MKSNLDEWIAHIVQDVEKFDSTMCDVQKRAEAKQALSVRSRRRSEYAAKLYTDEQIKIPDTELFAEPDITFHVAKDAPNDTIIKHPSMPDQPTKTLTVWNRWRWGRIALVTTAFMIGWWYVALSLIFVWVLLTVEVPSGRKAEDRAKAVDSDASKKENETPKGEIGDDTGVFGTRRSYY